MNVKLIIIAMIIVVVGGTVFTMVVLDDDDDDKLDIDVVRKDLTVGDYIKYNSDGIGELNITADMTRTEYLSGIYWTEDIPADARTGEWIYDGFKKSCYVVPTTVNGMKYEFYVMTDSKFIIHKHSIANNANLNLDTNMDIGLPMSEQTVTAGTYYSYSSAIESKIMSYDYWVSKKIDSVNGDSMKVVTNMNIRSGELVDLTIAELKSDGQVICDNEFMDEMSQTEYLRVIDYDSLISFLEQDGGTVVHGEKTQAVEDTFRGKRVVITEKIHVVDSGGTEKDLIVYYGLAGVIYEIVYEPIYEGAQRFTDTLTETNLLSVKS